MKRTVTWIAAALLILPAMLWAAGSEAPAAASEYSLTVLNPQGPVKKDRDLAPRLDTLEGKKVAMWLSATEDQLFAGKGAELYGALEKMLKEKYSDIEIVSYRDLPMKFAPEDEIVTAITEANPDAVVAGFGG